jgi:hypothetical protein
MDKEGNYDCEDIIIGMDRNALPWVISNPTNRVVVIRSYDTKGLEEEDLKVDENCDKYTDMEAEDRS